MMLSMRWKRHFAVWNFSRYELQASIQPVFTGWNWFFRLQVVLTCWKWFQPVETGFDQLKVVLTGWN
jgi:hypothetical protein